MAARCFVFCVMRVMSFAMGEIVSQFIVYKCVVGSSALGFAGLWWMILIREG